MSTTIQKLEELRDERLATIKGHQGHIASLQDMIDQCEGEIRGLELAIKLCEKSEPPPPNGTPVLIGKYANTGLTDAIFDVVQTTGNPLQLSLPGGGRAGQTE
jgi:hypothetical protein